MQRVRRMLWRRLLLPVLMLAPPSAQAQSEQFGRWQQQVQRCELEQRGAQPLRCQALQLDQRNAEVVRLILQADGATRGELLQFTLVGALAEGSEPMVCREGRCTLRQPLQVQLVSLSLARFDQRGLAKTLPSTWPVQGQCRIAPAALHCEASAEAAESSQAEIHWRVDAQLN
ncbi:MAG: hypothetical protein RLZZ11_525 [Cyanobacteriota bacterium]